LFFSHYQIQNLEWVKLFAAHSAVFDLERSQQSLFKVMMNVITSNTEEAICTAA